ncbi:peptide N-acetyl-beta-D-glucosaminyl asparaginase amidase A-domain-containing protein [Podospora australis]|uniref:Peptide N-acetyl-beta-D-glucosaminyl asparaginase amidase A-domain-containing protein n=1 Tax=Podospora australis TaxID=1536484 RepID=A0AAN7AM56_9PEZI|nr:peptide N-acetyl-beta-D-glucosaminyl asparaginase amidase A-domain-containing protein [Podospora australis]
MAGEEEEEKRRFLTVISEDENRPDDQDLEQCPGEEELQTPQRRHFITNVLLTAGILLLTLFATTNISNCIRSFSPGFAESASPAANHHHVVSSFDGHRPHKFSPAGVAVGKGVRSRAVLLEETSTTTSSAATPERTVLKAFEVAQPVLLPSGPADSDGSTAKDAQEEGLCVKLLMRRDFAWSYHDPFIGEYTPPDCKFNRVVLNFSSVSVGRQYDRLAIMYFGDTEVWRTSTAQPTIPPGISWIYLKDMTEYLYFWKQKQKIIFDLGNLINEKYTGIFNTTMTAIFYYDETEREQAPPSDLIIPISARQAANNAVSQFTLPAQEATNTIDSFPQNAKRAVFSVSANGQASEEFWWSNVLQQDTLAFNETAGELPGLSPFREVQVLIDGQLAGVEWPFPTIFTGGVVPSLHRPIVGIHAFDLREHEIDISAFLPILADGKPHTFSIKIAGIDASGNITTKVNENWYVTGKIFIWTSDSTISPFSSYNLSSSTTGPRISLSRKLGTTGNGTNETLSYTTDVQRTLSITSWVQRTGPKSEPEKITWKQSLTYTNKGLVSAFGFSQINHLVISGVDSATLDARQCYEAKYRYPLYVNSSYSVSPQGNLSIGAFVSQGKETEIWGRSVFPTGLEAFGSRGFMTAKIWTVKEGTAEFRQTGDGMSSTGWGEARQRFTFSGSSNKLANGDGDDEEEEKELYWRDVKAVNGSLVFDEKRIDGKVPGTAGDGKPSGVSSLLGDEGPGEEEGYEGETVLGQVGEEEEVSLKGLVENDEAI